MRSSSRRRRLLGRPSPRMGLIAGPASGSFEAPPVQADAQVVEMIRKMAPDVIVTHADRDPFNPDHGAASAAVQPACQRWSACSRFSS